MESMMASLVDKMEASYVDMASEEGGSCKYVPSCDPTTSCLSATGSPVWTHANTKLNAQFLNPITNSCTRLDKDANNFFVKKDASIEFKVITGREHQCDHLCNDQSS